jgi:tetratricopeptide (TPR) repeat protein
MFSRVSPQELEAQVRRIKASPVFKEAKKLHLFLDLLASRAVSQNGKNPITQGDISKALGLRDFDPTKPTVRIAAGRLRSRLMEFYATEGREDSVIIDFPKGRPYRLDARKKKSRELPPSGKTFQLCCDGRILWAQRTPESLEKAAVCFHEALRIDPHCAEAHAGLAECYLFMAICGLAPRKLMRPARMHAERAVSIAPYSPDAHAALASILSAFYWDWKRAGNQFGRAFELDPGSLTLYSLRANHLLSIGKPEDAAKDARRILQMTAAGPSPLVGSHAAKILYAAGKYHESEELLVHIREMIPDFYMVHWQLGLLYGTKGDLSTARESLEKAFNSCPKGPSTLAALGWISALAGQVGDAKKIAECLETDRRRGYIPGTDLAMIYAALGEMDRAFQWLNRAYRERALFLPWLSVWPPFKALYCDPRCIAILEQMGL